MHMCVHIIYIYIYIHTYIYIYIYIYIYTRTHTNTHTHTQHIHTRITCPERTTASTARVSPTFAIHIASSLTASTNAVVPSYQSLRSASDTKCLCVYLCMYACIYIWLYLSHTNNSVPRHHKTPVHACVFVFMYIYAYTNHDILYQHHASIWIRTQIYTDTQTIRHSATHTYITCLSFQTRALKPSESNRRIPVCVCVCMYVCMYVCVYVCMCAHVGCMVYVHTCVDAV